MHCKRRSGLSPRRVRVVAAKVRSFAKTQKAQKTLWRDQHGNVFSEYVVVLGTVVLTAGLAIYALGVPLTRSFYLAKLFILLPIP